jgi:hypothetical protein
VAINALLMLRAKKGSLDVALVSVLSAFSAIVSGPHTAGAIARVIPGFESAGLVPTIGLTALILPWALLAGFDKFGSGS